MIIQLLDEDFNAVVEVIYVQFATKGGLRRREKSIET